MRSVGPESLLEDVKIIGPRCVAEVRLQVLLTGVFRRGKWTEQAVQGEKRKRFS
jgi:hypothetical protein